MLKNVAAASMPIIHTLGTSHATALARIWQAAVPMGILRFQALRGEFLFNYCPRFEQCVYWPAIVLLSVP